MKKLLLAMALVMWSLSSMALTHTVARGESLQSIAQKYNISVDRLLEANPGAGKLFYVGLKLDIPENATCSIIRIDTFAYLAATDTRAVRKNVSLPAWMATLAEKRGVNCSQVLQDGLMQLLNAGHARQS